jgi:Family of unknown function (DUF6516)
VTMRIQAPRQARQAAKSPATRLCAFVALCEPKVFRTKPRRHKGCEASKALDQLTTIGNVVIITNMKAALILRERIVLDDDCFVELVVWKLPNPLSGSPHDFKYRLALVSQKVCVMRYDNEAGKGDHRHWGEIEKAYPFKGLAQLQNDFWDDVERWRQE